MNCSLVMFIQQPVLFTNIGTPKAWSLCIQYVLSYTELFTCCPFCFRAEACEIPDQRLIISIPSALHSQKPALSGILNLCHVDPQLSICKVYT